jgi:hypothetical protein
MAHVHKPVRMSAVEIEASIRTNNREPFQELLALLLEAAPNRESIQQFANKYPDRWVRMVAMLARLCGYAENATFNPSIATQISQLSDAELSVRLAKLDAQHRAAVRASHLLLAPLTRAVAFSHRSKSRPAHADLNMAHQRTMSAT